jgi:uncharacterized tellurite resistance protein B-like protein
MNISVMDRSNYFKGLLLLIRKDRRITEAEVRIMKRIGKTLDFERRFCENVIHDILENNYIVDAPLEFSTKEIAVKFIKDGLAIALSDNEIHPFEKEWLRAIAKKNGLTMVWFRQETKNALTNKQYPSHMEADDLIVGASLRLCF